MPARSITQAGIEACSQYVTITHSRGDKMKPLALFLCAVIAVSSLVGCGTHVSTKQPATFQHYESRGTGRYKEASPIGSSDLFPPREVVERTGNAEVRLSDGTVLSAKCPIQELDRGATVFAQQNSDGTWVVVGKR